MRQMIWWMVVLVMAASWPPPANASQTACPVGIESTPSNSLTDLHVASTLSYLVNGSCTGGQNFFSRAPDCPTPPLDVAAVSGAYCGPVVASASSVLCKWTVVSNTVTTALFVGFDWDGDGHLVAPQELVWGPMDAGTYYSVFNSGVAARMIAFPTNMDGSYVAEFDESIIGCAA